MKRLTDDKVAEALKTNIDKLKAIGYDVDLSNERYVRLAEYEQTGLTPEQIKQVVRCKDCAFIDTLECRLNYIDKQRLIFTNRAPDWYCADGRPKGWEDEI